MYNASVIIFKSQAVIYILTDVTANQRNKEIKVIAKRPIIYGQIKLPFKYFLRTSEAPGKLCRNSYILSFESLALLPSFGECGQETGEWNG